MNIKPFETNLYISRNSVIIHNPCRPKMYVKGVDEFNNFSNVSAYNGKMSECSRKRLRKAINILNTISDWQNVYNPIIRGIQSYRLTFITLTIPFNGVAIDHKLAYLKLFKPMLRIMRDKFKMTSYIWKAELTKKNQLHYHLTSNIFIRHDLVRFQWNKLLRKLRLLDKYAAEKGHYNAPSTEIRSVRNDKDIEIYLSKYISKVDDKERHIDGKIWDCSLNLKKAKKFKICLDSKHIDNIAALYAKGVKYEFEDDFFCYINFVNEAPLMILNGLEHKLFREWKEAILTARAASQPSPFRSAKRPTPKPYLLHLAL